MRRTMTSFTLTALILLPVAMLLSGTRLLDWAYEMPDLWQIDDLVIAGLEKVDAVRAALGLGDAFGALRGFLHDVTGLGSI